ncbi:siroheme synthase CysG [Fretibacter rubidus]|uniref:siroheme synthase CysG n=1 Tax=Fretibacter rubidus TaxID=570162 RepID=UPI00352B06FB
MRYLPVHVDTQGKSILIVGGGPAAEAKLRTLTKTDAVIRLISPEVGDEVARWVEDGLMTWEQRSFKEADLDDVILVYAATEDDDVNAKIAALATDRGLLVNAADQKDACAFITPALVDRSPVIVSIGTEGTSPSLARALKSEMEQLLPPTVGALANKINVLRAHVKRKFESVADRQRFWADIFDGRDLRAQLRVSEDVLDTRVAEKLAGEVAVKKGSVTLVGAGPGSSDLLTLGARRVLHSADVIVYDRLVSQDILDFGRREAEYIYVGKTPGGASTAQDDINTILVQKAREGHAVVRLKSGDPLIFGRADEELDALSTHGIDYAIIPGITAAAAAAASIGASLTTRGRNKSVSFLTGHDAKGFADQDWKSLAAPHARAAVYMGVGASRFIQGRLLIHGADRDMAVTIVENASRDNQIIVATTLSDLPNAIESRGIKGPAILLLGYAPRDAAVIAPNMGVAL